MDQENTFSSWTSGGSEFTSSSTNSLEMDTLQTPGLLSGNEVSEEPITSRNIELRGTFDSPVDRGQTKKHTERVTINVGGQSFVTLQKTLERVPNSRLAQLNKDDHHYDEKRDEYYFDRSPRLFELIMNFYRTGELHLPACICGPSMKTELLYWGIDEASISTCCWRNYKRHDHEQETLKDLKRVLDTVTDDENEEQFVSSQKSEELCKRPWWIKKLWRFLDRPQSSKAAQVN